MGKNKSSLRGPKPNPTSAKLLLTANLSQHHDVGDDNNVVDIPPHHRWQPDLSWRNKYSPPLTVTGASTATTTNRDALDALSVDDDIVAEWGFNPPPCSDESGNFVCGEVAGSCCNSDFCFIDSVNDLQDNSDAPSNNGVQKKRRLNVISEGGGSINIDSDDGEGTSVTWELPSNSPALSEDGLDCLSLSNYDCQREEEEDTGDRGINYCLGNKDGMVAQDFHAGVARSILDHISTRLQQDVIFGDLIIPAGTSFRHGQSDEIMTCLAVAQDTWMKEYLSHCDKLPDSTTKEVLSSRLAAEGINLSMSYELMTGAAICHSINVSVYDVATNESFSILNPPNAESSLYSPNIPTTARIETSVAST